MESTRGCVDDSAYARFSIMSLEVPESGHQAKWKHRLIYYLPLIPVASTFIGVPRIFLALYMGVRSVSRVSEAFFSYHKDRLLSCSVDIRARRRVWRTECKKEKKILKIVLQLLARGFLECIPVVGNVAIYYSVWYQGSDTVKKMREKELFKLLCKGLDLKGRHPNSLSELRLQIASYTEGESGRPHKHHHHKKRP